MNLDRARYSLVEGMGIPILVIQPASQSGDVSSLLWRCCREPAIDALDVAFLDLTRVTTEWRQG